MRKEAETAQQAGAAASASQAVEIRGVGGIVTHRQLSQDSSRPHGHMQEASGHPDDDDSTGFSDDPHSQIGDGGAPASPFHNRPDTDEGGHGTTMTSDDDDDDDDHDSEKSGARRRRSEARRRRTAEERRHHSKERRHHSEEAHSGWGHGNERRRRSETSEERRRRSEVRRRRSSETTGAPSTSSAPPELEHMPSVPPGECRSQTCGDGKFCSVEHVCQACHLCVNNPVPTSISGDCEICSGHCNQHDDCEIGEYCSTQHKCIMCRECTTGSDSITGTCSSCDGVLD